MEKPLLMPAPAYFAVDLTEAGLIQAMQAQDQRALTLLYDRYSAALYHIVLKIVKEKELAEDVLQEAFVKIWFHFPDYEQSKGRLFTWLLNVTRNLAIDKTRSASFKHRSLTRPFGKSQSHRHHVSMRTYQPELLGLEALFVHLKAEERRLIELIYFQGYTQPEVADQLSIPLGTVKTRLRTAMHKLRKCFSPRAALAGCYPLSDAS